MDGQANEKASSNFFHGSSSPHVSRQRSSSSKDGRAIIGKAKCAQRASEGVMEWAASGVGGKGKGKGKKEEKGKKEVGRWSSNQSQRGMHRQHP